MATKKTAGNEAKELLDRLGGCSAIVLTDVNGVEHRGRDTRRLVKEMEADGVTADAAIRMFDSGTLTGIEEFLERFAYPAFRAEEPGLGFDEFVEVWECQEDKTGLIETLILLFSVPSISLVQDPTGTRQKFRLV